MSGYLERLVAGSRRPPSIKPILGSVFTAPQFFGIPEVFEETFKEAGAIEQRNEDAAPGARQENAAEEPKPAVAAAPSRETHASFPVATRLVTTRLEGARPEAARDNRQSIPVIRQIADFEPLVGEPGIAPASVRNETEAQRERVESTEAPADTVSAYRPLVTENGRHTGSEVRPFKSSDTFVSAITRTTKQDLPRSSETASREPDEIQIHIGRIEVVAVPQQQAIRPAAKSSRKSLSLDEYLKRGRRGG